MDGETKAGCLNLLFEIPYVSWIFLLGPPFLVIFGVEGLLKISLTDSNWFILILSILLLIWLRFLETRVGHPDDTAVHPNSLALDHLG